MTQQDKQILIQDLCARLPYGVMVNFNDGVHSIKEKLWSIDTDCGTFNCEDWTCANTKPYLRPMDNMTEEERREFLETEGVEWTSHWYTCASYDWLNAHHFDYRGLIDKGLAIAVTEENNPYK